MKTLFLIVSILICFSAFSTAHATSYTKETIVGNWREMGDNQSSWEFKENGTITCVGKCDYGDMPQAYEVDESTTTIIWTKEGKRVHRCDMVGSMLQIGKYQFSKI